MIDITTIQANPIPENIFKLQTANSKISSENKIMKNIFIAIVIAGVIIIGYHIIKKNKERENDK